MRGTILAFIATAFFNLYALACKLIVEDMDPVIFLILTEAAAGIFMIALMDLSSKIKETGVNTIKDLLPLFLIGLLSSAVAPVLFLWGLKLTSLTNSVLISRAEGVIMSVLAVFALKETITKHQIAGTAVMFSGIWFISASVPSGGASMGIGDVLVFMSAAAYALSNVLFKKYMHHLPAEFIVSLRNLFGAAALVSVIVVLSMVPGFYAPGSPTLDNGVQYMIIFAIAAMLTGQFVWYIALEKTSASRVSAAILFSPVIGVAFAASILGEAITAAHLAGGALIIGGLILMEYHTRKVKGPEKRKYHLRLRPIQSA